MSSDEPAPDKKGGLLPDAIVVIVLTAMAYMFVLFYELATAFYLGIPQELVSVDWRNSGKLVGLALLALVPAVGFNLRYSGGSVTRRYLLLLIPASVVALGMWMLPMPGGTWGTQFAWPMGFVVAGMFAFESLLLRLVLERRRDALTLWTASCLGILLVAGAPLYVARDDVAQRRTYSVIQRKPPELVLRRYGDALVIATFDRDAHTVGPTYRLQLLSVPAILAEENVGPLHPAQKDTSSWGGFFR